MSDGGNCSFCGKRSGEVFRLISADGAKICSECVGRCADMIAREFRAVVKDLNFPPASGSDDNGDAS